jgi:hypothetical protein
MPGPFVFETLPFIKEALGAIDDRSQKKADRFGSKG